MNKAVAFFAGIEIRAAAAVTAPEFVAYYWIFTERLDSAANGP